ncbi:MAG: FadR family transcriptional regulator [Pseudonocardia sp.]|nr:FadR family transcriptional regulator [Pseudonocardia sp.]
MTADVPSSRQLGSGSVVQRVENALRDDLAYGRWLPGERLPSEAALARDLGVGRSSLREAIQLLSRDGLLVVRQGAGTYAAEHPPRPELAGLTRNDQAHTSQLVRRARIVEVYQVRRALEVEAARLAAEHARPDDVEALKRALDRRQRAVGGDTVAFVEADTEFHRCVVAITGNSLLLALFDQFREPLGHALAALVDQEPLPDTADEHAALLDAISAGDPVAAAKATIENFDVIIELFRTT